MNKQLSRRQAISIVVMFIVGSSAVSGIAKGAKENAWIAVIFAALLSIPIYLIYSGLMKAYPQKNIYKICEAIFGKYLGKLLTIFLIFNGFYLSAHIFRVLIEFVYTTGLDTTPRLVIIALVVLLTIFILKKGIIIFGRWNEIFLIVIVIVLIMATALLMPNANIDNLRPILYEGIGPVQKSVISTLVFPFTQVFILLGIMDHIKPQVSVGKVFFYSLLIGTLILLTIVIGNIVTIGGVIYEKSYFPSYMSLRRLDVGETIQRVEIFIVALFMVVNFAKITLATFITVVGIKSLFNFKGYKNMVTPVTLLVGILTYLAYDNLVDQKELVTEIFPIYAMTVQVIVPTCIYIIYLLKMIIINNIKRSMNG